MPSAPVGRRFTVDPGTVSFGGVTSSVGRRPSDSEVVPAGDVIVMGSPAKWSTANVPSPLSLTLPVTPWVIWTVVAPRATSAWPETTLSLTLPQKASTELPPFRRTVNPGPLPSAGTHSVRVTREVDGPATPIFTPSGSGRSTKLTASPGFETTEPLWPAASRKLVDGMPGSPSMASGMPSPSVSAGAGGVNVRTSEVSTVAYRFPLRPSAMLWTYPLNCSWSTSVPDGEYVSTRWRSKLTMWTCPEPSMATVSG